MILGFFIYTWAVEPRRSPGSVNRTCNGVFVLSQTECTVCRLHAQLQRANKVVWLETPSRDQ